MWLSLVEDFNDVFELVPRYDKFLERTYDENLRKEFAFQPPDVSWHDFQRVRQMMQGAILPGSERIKIYGMQRHRE